MPVEPTREARPPRLDTGGLLGFLASGPARRRRRRRTCRPRGGGRSQPLPAPASPRRQNGQLRRAQLFLRSMSRCPHMTAHRVPRRKLPSSSRRGGPENQAPSREKRIACAARISTLGLAVSTCGSLHSPAVRCERLERVRGERDVRNSLPALEDLLDQKSSKAGPA